MSAGPQRELEFKLSLRDEADVEAVVAALPGAARLDAGVLQHNDFFDTADGGLRSGGYVLRLRDEAGRQILTAKGPLRRHRDAALADKAEEELELDTATAGSVSSGDLSPLAVLQERLAGPALELVAALGEVVADAPLVRVGRYTNLRRRLGPLALVPDTPAVVFEFDRTELPGDRVDREVEVEVPADAADACGDALRAVLDRAGVPWVPSTSKAKRLFALLQGSGGD